jgi:hypothetical protein
MSIGDAEGERTMAGMTADRTSGLEQARCRGPGPADLPRRPECHACGKCEAGRRIAFAPAGVDIGLAPSLHVATMEAARHAAS